MPETHHWLISGDEVTSAATSATGGAGCASPHHATPTATTMIRGTTIPWTFTSPLMPASTVTTQTPAMSRDPTRCGRPKEVCTAAPAPASMITSVPSRDAVMHRSANHVGMRDVVGFTSRWMSVVRSVCARRSTMAESRKKRAPAMMSAPVPPQSPKLTKYCRISLPEA